MSSKSTSAWVEISIETNGEGAEAVCEVMNRYVHGGAVVESIPAPLSPDGLPAAEQVIVRGYLPAEDTAACQRLEEALWHLSQIYPLPAPRIRPLAAEDWAESWKRHFTVLHVGRRLVIKPSWETYTPTGDEVVIELDPGMAFGTGLHPSTRLCLQLLEEHLQPGMCVLDMGTGSGILAIAAARLGASAVLAVDVDSQAIDSARHNVAVNGVADRVQVVQGSLDAVRAYGAATQSRPYDMVLVNILARVIVELVMAGLADYLRPGGLIIASGIIEEQTDQVALALHARGVRVMTARQEKDWVALLGKKEWCS